jgi:hypothetical protein
MKILVRFFLLWLIGMLSIYADAASSAPSVIPENRIAELEVECHTFNSSTKKIKLQVLDVTANSVKKIFDDLFKNNFPIYYTSGYENRVTVDGSMVSLHAYGAAIDINEYINPYFKVSQGLSSIDPKRYPNKTEDEEQLRANLKNKGIIDESELNATVGAIIQKEGSVDWFINREISRKGMLGPKEAHIFAKNGFNIWGGRWEEPVDFMHFQISRSMAEHLATISKEEGDIVWANHLLINEWHAKLMEKLERLDKKQRVEVMQDHFNKCQQNVDSEGERYFAAANKKETTAICINDCRYKIEEIEKHFGMICQGN